MTQDTSIESEHILLMAPVDDSGYFNLPPHATILALSLLQDGSRVVAFVMKSVDYELYSKRVAAKQKEGKKNHLKRIYGLYSKRVAAKQKDGKNG